MRAERAVAETPPWTPFETRRRLRDEKREAVLRMAVRLFLEQGYHRTPLASIAERLNITKPALYNYFASKEDILNELFRLGEERHDEIFGLKRRAAGHGLEGLKAMIRAYTRTICTDYGMCFARLDDRELGEAQRAAVRRSKRRYDRAFRSQIERGIADGSIRPCNAKLAAYAVAGALNGIADWWRPGGGLSVEAVAEDYAIMLTRGLTATNAA